MNFTQDEIAAVIGAKELEIIALRRELAKAQDELQKLREPKAQELRTGTDVAD